MSTPLRDAPLWDSCRALIDESRRQRTERQNEWNALLADRARLSGLGLAFLSEAYARLAAQGCGDNERPTPLP